MSGLSAAMTTARAPDFEWQRSAEPVAYEDAVAAMDERVEAITRDAASELIWFLEHPPLYTAGTSAKPEDLTAPDRFPVHKTGRGGQYTYHGPGQRIAYVMVDVRQRFGGDVRAFVTALEMAVIDALVAFGVSGHLRQGRVGVWVERPELGAGREDKIAALGIRIRRGVSLHGVALNVSPDLDHYSGIVPCGIAEFGVTSLQDLGLSASSAEVDRALQHALATRLAMGRRCP